jgi:hypothetical protein
LVPSAVPGAEPQSGIRVAANIFMIARRFEDLEAWQLANEVKKRVYALLDISKARQDRKFCEQITESAASAPANLSEGFGYTDIRNLRGTRALRNLH